MKTHSEKYEMLTVFLIYADLRPEKNKEDAVSRKLRKEQDELFWHLRTCSLNDQHKIVIVINTIKFYKMGDDDDIKPEERDTTRLMVVEPRQGKMSNRRNRISAVIHHGKPVKVSTPRMLQKADALCGLFGIIQQHYPANHRMLITWDHGSVFGINKSVNETALRSMKMRFLNSTLEGYASGQSEVAYQKPVNGRFTRFWDVSISRARPGTDNMPPNIVSGMLAEVAFAKTSERNISPVDKRAEELTRFLAVINAGEVVEGTTTTKMDDILENAELSEALEKGFGGVDLVVMMNCMMMNFHTIYALHGSARYLVAPQGRIDKPAYDYRAIINEINRTVNNNVSLESIVRFVIESSFRKERSSPDLTKTVLVSCDEVEEIERWALFGIKLQSRQVEEIGALLNIFARVAVKGKTRKRLQKQFGRTRSKCFEFSMNLNYYQVDLLNFMSKNLRYFNGESYLMPFFKIKKEIAVRWDSITVASGVGSDPYYVENVPAFRDFKPTPSGLSVYFPEGMHQGRRSSVEYKTFISPHSTSQCAFLRDQIYWLRFLKWMRIPKISY